jgi:membrane protein implicated in regulation of membrane protease activity
VANGPQVVKLNGVEVADFPERSGLTLIIINALTSFKMGFILLLILLIVALVLLGLFIALAVASMAKSLGVALASSASITAIATGTGLYFTRKAAKARDTQSSGTTGQQSHSPSTKEQQAQPQASARPEDPPPEA